MSEVLYMRAAVGAGEGKTSATVERAWLWSGEFADSGLEADFREATWTETIERMRAAQIAVYAFLAWGIVEYFLIGPEPVFFILLAGRLMTLFLARVPLIFFAKAEQHASFYASLTFAQFFAFGVFLVLVRDGGVAFAELSLSAVLIIFAYYFGIPNRLKLNILVSFLSTVAFVAVISDDRSLPMRSLAVTAVLLCIANVVGTQATRVTNRLRRREFLTLMRQKELNEQLTREIAVRQEAQRAVQTTEESFQSIFLAAPLPLALVDPVTYGLIQANRSALALLGMSEEDVKGIDARAFFVDDETYDRLAAAIGRRSRGVIEARLSSRRHGIVWANISVVPVRFHGQPAFLIALQDETERRREAEALREARDDATAASRSKSEFLANMSHELRTPLNAIIGFSEALERELFGPVGNPRYREYAEDIRDSGVHLLNLINDILDLSKIEAGHFRLHEDEADLNTVVASACRIVRHRAQQASITIEIDMPSPSIGLFVDERALKQILINLISNAVKFSEDRGKVRIIGAVKAEGLRLAVADDGIGIAREDIPKALAPFTQVDGTLSRAHEGTGLGLPLAKHLAELHGGELTIESELGVGTTVYVDLPAARLTPCRESQTAV